MRKILFHLALILSISSALDLWVDTLRGKDGENCGRNSDSPCQSLSFALSSFEDSKETLLVHASGNDGSLNHHSNFGFPSLKIVAGEGGFVINGTDSLWFKNKLELEGVTLFDSRAIFNYYTSLTRCRVIDSSISSNPRSEAEQILVVESSIENSDYSFFAVQISFQNSNFSYNRGQFATSDGGIYINGCNFNGNTDGLSAELQVNASLSILNTNFVNGVGDSPYYSSPLFIKNTKEENLTVIMENVLFFNNTAANCGGGLSFEGSGNEYMIFLDWSNVRISNNSAQMGGGLCATNAVLYLNGLDVSYNNATLGGGAYLVYSSLYNANFTGNNATSGTVVVANKKGKKTLPIPYLSQVVIKENNANRWGGFYSTNEYDSQYDSVTVVDNNPNDFFMSNSIPVCMNYVVECSRCSGVCMQQTNVTDQDPVCLYQGVDCICKYNAVKKTLNCPMEDPSALGAGWVLFLVFVAFGTFLAGIYLTKDLFKKWFP